MKKEANMRVKYSSSPSDHLSSEKQANLYLAKYWNTQLYRRSKCSHSLLEKQFWSPQLIYSQRYNYKRNQSALILVFWYF